MTRFNPLPVQFNQRQRIGGVVHDCGGINTFAHETEIKDNQLTVGKNLDLSTVGKIKKRLGRNRVLNDPGGNAVVGLIYFKAAAVDERMIMVQGTTIYQSTLPLATSGSWSDLTVSNVTADKYSTTMCNAEEKIFISNGTDTVKYHNGAGVLACTDTNTDPPKAKVMVYHKNRLWAFNTSSYPDWGWYSDALDTLTFNRTTNVFKVASGEAVEITAALSSGDSILIFKETSIHELVIAGATATYWTLRPIETRHGCCSYYCAVKHGGTIYYFSFSGIRTLGGQFDEIPMSKLVKETWDTINWDYVNRSRMVVWDNKLYLSVPTSTSTSPNTVLVWDILTQTWSVITGWNVGAWGIFLEKTAGSTNAFEETLMYGEGNDGWVNHCFKSTQFNDQSTAIDFHIETKAFDFGMPSIYKEGGIFVLNVEQGPHADDSALTIQASIDGGAFSTLTAHSGYEYPLDSLGVFKKIMFKVTHNATSKQQVIITGYEVETYPTRIR